MLSLIFFSFVITFRAQSIVWNAFISRTVQTVLKSVPMGCRGPAASSSNTLRPTTNAIPATLTAPRGKRTLCNDRRVCLLVQLQIEMHKKVCWILLPNKRKMSEKSRKDSTKWRCIVCVLVWIVFEEKLFFIINFTLLFFFNYSIWTFVLFLSNFLLNASLPTIWKQSFSHHRSRWVKHLNPVSWNPEIIEETDMEEIGETQLPLSTSLWPITSRCNIKQQDLEWHHFRFSSTGGSCHLSLVCYFSCLEWQTPACLSLTMWPLMENTRLTFGHKHSLPKRFNFQKIQADGGN